MQRDHDPVQTATLKRLVAPFILRRLKTDKAIIADLPDKVEALQYRHLKCIFAFPYSRDELDALPEGFCEPDLSALVAAGIARPLR